jgi:hypothetical protein
MKRLLIVSLFLLVPSGVCLADSQVESHLFDDLNGNLQSDIAEGESTYSQPENIEEEFLPPTPDEEPAGESAPTN